jgi:hypothetical protein
MAMGPSGGRGSQGRTKRRGRHFILFIMACGFLIFHSRKRPKKQPTGSEKPPVRREADGRKEAAKKEEGRKGGTSLFIFARLNPLWDFRFKTGKRVEQSSNCVEMFGVEQD